MKIALKSITPDAELNIVEIARVSSSRVDKTEKPEGLISYLIKNKHWSPFEHSFLTFEIITSKAIGIQLLRHRSFTFQEFSQRYAVVENIEQFEIREQAATNRQSSTEVFDPCISANYREGKYEGQQLSIVLDKFIDIGQQLYKEMLALGVAKECARMILPMATQTTIFMTGSIRSWIHFLDIRDDGHAQKEAQEIAREIKNIFIDQLPLISAAKEYVKR
jgi:thymidylate synthase (FAD)